MKTKDLRQMTNEELNEKLKSLKVELFNLRFSHATGGLKNPVVLNTTKKDIIKALQILKAHATDAKRIYYPEIDDFSEFSKFLQQQ